MQKENSIAVPLIINSRVFPYKRDLVFEAWGDPRLLAKWWGPHGFTNSIYLFEFRNGGYWELTMHGPDGIDYPNVNRFMEIIPGEKIVFEHLEPIHSFTASAEFEEQGEGTLLRFSMAFDLLSEYEKLRDFITGANEENFDRLEYVLSNLK